MLNFRPVLIAATALLVSLPAIGSRATTPQTVAQNQVCELTFQSNSAVASDGQRDFDAVFTKPSGEVLRVPGFWAGDRTWKVRFASPQTGAYLFRTACSDVSDQGLHGQTGTVTVTEYTGTHPLYRHGPLRVTADKRFIEHHDGTPFFWLGDTWWMGLSERLDWPNGFQTLTADRKAKGFNVIQIVGGLPPDMPPLDPRGANEGGQAWTDNFEQIRPEFYNAADRRIEHLVRQGLVPCIVGAWKHYLPVMGPEKMKRHWRNVIARYAAYPVLWIVGGEVNRTAANPKFMDGRAPAMETSDAAFERGWSDVARLIHATDPFQRIVGAHNQQNPFVLDDPTLLDMYFLQTGHSALCSISAQADWFDQVSHAKHRGPLILSEGNYQWLFHDGSYDDQIQRHQFWATALLGGAGHTYGANGIWQVNQPEQPFGASPHGFVWGNTPWSEAMNHAASEQLGWSKAYLSELPWRKLVPANDQVRFVLPDLPPVDETDAAWIEMPDDRDGDRVIGTTFDLPADSTIRRAVLRLASEASYSLAINGQMVHRNAKLEYADHLKHQTAWSFPLAGEYLQPGRNTLLLDYGEEHIAADHSLLADLAIEFSDGPMMHVPSDGRWRWQRPDAGWPGYKLQLDPSQFASAASVASDTDNRKVPSEFLPIATYGPMGATIPGQLWLVYAPAAVSVEVAGLRADAEFLLERFNPRTNERIPEQTIRSDSFGRWRWDPPRQSGDWVLLVREVKR